MCIIAAGVGLLLEVLIFCIFGQISSVLHIWIIWPVVLQSMKFPAVFYYHSTTINTIKPIKLCQKLGGSRNRNARHSTQQCPRKLVMKVCSQKRTAGLCPLCPGVDSDTTQRWLIGMEPVCFSIDISVGSC